MKKNSVILLFIIVVATILRLYNFTTIPFMHDEFSALFRTQFDNFSDLIKLGVMPDGHPAGVQVFLYYWTKIVGFNNFWVKIPFIIAGILTIYVVYLIVKQWFNETVGLLVASFIASCESFIMYSQIARPYSIGLLFASLSVLYWSKMFFDTENLSLKKYVFYVIFTSLATYSHYFSLLLVAIVGISGFFFVNKQNFWKYLLAELTVLLLFLPHLKIFLYQLNIGGLGWLGKPDKYFIFNYLQYVFHYSYLLIFVVVTLIIFNITKPQKSKIKFYLLSFSWFIIPFVLAYYYSIHYKPILQFAVLFFGLPFLIIFLFSLSKQRKFIVNLIFVVVLLSINIFTLINHRQYYKLFYNSIFRKVLTDYELHNNDNTISIIESKENINSYLVKELNIDTNFYFFDNKDKISTEQYIIKKYNSCDSLYLGCLANIQPNLIPLIRMYYPKISIKNDYYLGSTYVFTKNNFKSDSSILLNLTFDDNNFQKIYVDTSFIDDSIYYSSKFSYFCDRKEYLLNYSQKISNLSIKKSDFIDISAKIFLKDSVNDFMIVTSIKNGDSTIYWKAASINQFVQDSGKWGNISSSLKFSDINLNVNDTSNIVEIYFWNSGKNQFFIDNYQIRIRKGNPYMYGLYYKF